MQGFYQIEHLVMAKLISLSFLLLDLDSLMIMKELGKCNESSSIERNVE